MTGAAPPQPAATVAILGGGQLGRMLALAGAPIGVRCRFLDVSPAAPAREVGDFIAAPDFSDRAALARLAEGAAVATYEFENVPAEAVELLAGLVEVHPSAETLRAAQDRALEKRLFEKIGVNTTNFAEVSDESSLRAAAERIGFPSVLKTRRMGYDGKGQAVVREVGELPDAWARIARKPAILEEFVPFERELSVLAVRSRSGDFACYPLVQNEHRAGILRISTPAENVAPALQNQAETAARALMESTSAVGVIAIEFFEAKNRLIANEFAPRVHNSGHWTIEGAECSQFENHLRAILGWPLGSTAPVGKCALFTIIGIDPDPALRSAVLGCHGAHLHLYGKSAAPGRKTGHVTICAHDEAQLRTRIGAVRSALAAAGLVNSAECSIG